MIKIKIESLTRILFLLIHSFLNITNKVDLFNSKEFKICSHTTLVCEAFYEAEPVVEENGDLDSDSTMIPDLIEFEGPKEVISKASQARRKRLIRRKYLEDRKLRLRLCQVIYAGIRYYRCRRHAENERRKMCNH